MPVPASINDLSTTPGSNSPAGSESPATIDDYLRAHAAFIASLRDSTAGAIVRTGATGSAVMPVGTTAQRDGSPLAGYTRWNTTISSNETYNGTHWVPDGWMELPSVAASGSAVDITGLSAYPWATEVEVLLDSIEESSATTHFHTLQIGPLAGVVTSNYKTSSISISALATPIVTDNHTDAFKFRVTNNIGIVGVLRLSKAPGTNIWGLSGSVRFGDRSLVGQGLSPDIGGNLEIVRWSVSAGALNGGNFRLKIRK